MGFRCDILVAFSYGCISVYDNSDLTSHESAHRISMLIAKSAGVRGGDAWVIRHRLLAGPPAIENSNFRQLPFLNTSSS